MVLSRNQSVARGAIGESEERRDAVCAVHPRDGGRRPGAVYAGRRDEERARARASQHRRAPGFAAAIGGLRDADDGDRTFGMQVRAEPGTAVGVEPDETVDDDEIRRCGQCVERRAKQRQFAPEEGAGLVSRRGGQAARERVAWRSGLPIVRKNARNGRCVIGIGCVQYGEARQAIRRAKSVATRSMQVSASARSGISVSTP